MISEKQDHSSIYLRVVDVEIEISGDDHRLIGFFEELWKPFVVPALPEGARSTIAIERTNTGWTIDAEGRDPQFVSEPWGLALDLRLIVDDVVRRAHPELIDVHAAMARVGDATVLLPGDPGAGKTTLMLEGLGRGWTLLCDDLAFLIPDTGEVIPLPRPIGVRSGTPLERFSDAWSPASWLPNPEGRPYAIPASAFSFGPGEPSAVDLIVFPRYQVDEPTEFVPLADAETLTRLARHVDPLSASSLQVLRKTCARSRGASLSYRHPSEGADEVSRAVSGLRR